MIKFSVMYPARPDARFDHAYYREKHMPMVQAKMGEACLRIEIDEPLPVADGAPAPAYVAIGHIYSPSLEAFQAAFGPHAKAIRADIPNYTDIAPTTLMSQVLGG